MNRAEEVRSSRWFKSADTFTSGRLESLRGAERRAITQALHHINILQSAFA